MRHRDTLVPPSHTTQTLQATHPGCLFYWRLISVESFLSLFLT